MCTATPNFPAMWCRSAIGSTLRHRPPQLPPLPFRDTGPHASALRIGQGVGEALLPHRADRTDGPGLGRVAAERREEHGRVLTPACGPLHPLWPAQELG